MKSSPAEAGLAQLKPLLRLASCNGKLRATWGYLVGYGAVYSFIAQLKRCFGKQVAELLASWHVTCGAIFVAVL